MVTLASPVARQFIRAADVANTTGLLLGTAGFGQLTRLNDISDATNFSTIIGNQDSTNGRALQITYGTTASATLIAQFTKLGITLKQLASSADPGAGLGTLYAGTDGLYYFPGSGAAARLARASEVTGTPKLAETVLGSAAASITFSSISQIYRHLFIEIWARGDTAAGSINVRMRMGNGSADTSADYDYQYDFASAASVSAVEAFSQTSILVGTAPASTATANVFGATRIDVLNYSSATMNKDVRSYSAHKQGTSTGLLINQRAVGFWRSNQSIDTITLLPSAGNFDTGTVASLYALPN